MTESKPSESDGMREDDFVSRFRPDPGQPATPYTKLVGFVGRDLEDGFLRVYLTAQLDTYVRVPAGDVLERRAPDEGEDSTGRSVLYVRQDADLDHVTPVARKLQADFMTGDITDGFLRTAGSGFGGQGNQAALISTPICSIVTVSIIVVSVITAATPGCPKPTGAKESKISCCLCTFRGSDC